MKKAEIFVKGYHAGTLTEIEKGKEYTFEYIEGYRGYDVSLAMPGTNRIYKFESFPPFFDGLLPEGIQLEGLLKTRKIDRYDYFSQLVAVGNDMVGAVTVKEVEE